MNVALVLLDYIEKFHPPPSAMRPFVKILGLLVSVFGSV